MWERRVCPGRIQPFCFCDSVISIYMHLFCGIGIPGQNTLYKMCIYLHNSVSEIPSGFQEIWNFRAGLGNERWEGYGEWGQMTRSFRHLNCKAETCCFLDTVCTFSQLCCWALSFKLDFKQRMLWNSVFCWTDWQIMPSSGFILLRDFWLPLVENQKVF